MDNAWIDSYLEALLTQGLSNEFLKSTQEDERGFLNTDRRVAAKYYLQQILEQDEVGMWNAWRRVSATRNAEDRDVRLEFLIWRVWHLKRRKLLKKEEQEQEQDFLDMLSDSDIDSDEEEEEPNQTPTIPSVQVGTAEFPEVELPEIGESEGEQWNKVYIVMISLHGLVRGEAMELGKDADTGGQVKYVVELAREMALHPLVHRVDLLTRQICDPAVDKSYGVEEECIQMATEPLSGAYIVRLPCGPPEEYIRKEQLWAHVREFADRGLAHVRAMQERLAEVCVTPGLYYIHGHYADAGEVAALMSHTLGADMLLTGHSLGRNKLEHLLEAGRLTMAEIEKTYSISRRIEAEERALDGALMVFTSTKQEIELQWGLYDGYDPAVLGSILRRRRIDHHMPRFRVVPPGLNFRTIQEEGPSGQEPLIWNEVFRFLTNPRKPVILALSRPDAKKNITTLVKAFGEDGTLRDLANLVLIMGNRDAMDSLPKGSKSVLTEVLKLIDDYDLYGSVAYPKHHKQNEVKHFYQLVEKTKGVFINPALQEPFGLTLIEAAAHGAPIVATKNGGPVDIVDTLKNGLLVDPLDSKAISKALLEILTERRVWEEYSKNGLENIGAYSWTGHCQQVIKHVSNEKKYQRSVREITPFGSSWDDRIFKQMKQKPGGDVPALDDFAVPLDPQERLLDEELDTGLPRAAVRKRLIIVAVDNSRLGKEAIKMLKGMVAKTYGQKPANTASHDEVKAYTEKKEKSKIGFGVVSVLSLNQTNDLLDSEGIKAEVDFVVSGNGSDLFVARGTSKIVSYEPYDAHIDHLWNQETVERVLSRIYTSTGKKLLTDFGESTEQLHIIKEVSKHAVENRDDVSVTDRVRARLRKQGLRVSCFLQVDTSKGSDFTNLVHVTPIRASRSLAIRFLAHRLSIDMEDVVLICFASSIEQSSVDGKETIAAGFATSDASSLVGGAQRVVIVPPTEENMVRTPKDRLDERMIQKLKLECGPNVFKDRVVLFEGQETNIDDPIRNLF